MTLSLNDLRVRRMPCPHGYLQGHYQCEHPDDGKPHDLGSGLCHTCNPTPARPATPSDIIEVALGMDGAIAYAYGDGSVETSHFEAHLEPGRYLVLPLDSREET